MALLDKVKKPKKAKPEAAVVTEAMYQTILRPVITEKATMGSQYSQVSFWVCPNSTKPQIKAAVEALFNVTVEKVNTVNHKGKSKVFKGRKGIRSDKKKAVVRLAAGQMIDVSTGLAK